MRANEQEITLTLDMAWDLCLNQQWDWIKAEIEAGSKLSVNALKDQWMEESGYEDVGELCFFCEYAGQQLSIDSLCENCPGALVDPEFRCYHSKYHFGKKPLAFHAELVRLNKIRLELKEQ